MRKVLEISSLLAACALSGCMSTDEDMAGTSEPVMATSMNVVDITAADRMSRAPMAADEVDSFGAIGQPPLYSSIQGAYKGRPLTKHIGDYVKALTQDLIANMEYVSNKTPVGVTHFALGQHVETGSLRMYKSDCNTDANATLGKMFLTSNTSTSKKF